MEVEMKDRSKIIAYQNSNPTAAIHGFEKYSQ